LQATVDALPHPTIAEEANGAGTIETYTIVHGRDGAPERAPVIGRLDDGHRFLATIAGDATSLAALEREELVGRRGRVNHRDGGNRFEVS
jgi:acetyl-CoA C-acetyltransferase